MQDVRLAHALEDGEEVVVSRNAFDTAQTCEGNQKGPTDTN
jgi:hypothetical protein